MINITKLFFLAVAMMFVAATQSQAQVGPQSTFQLYNGYADVCLASNVTKVSVPINITTNVTTQLVALAAGKTITVCGMRFTAAGTTTALTFQTGTGSLCATGLAALSGTMLFPVAGFFNLGSEGQIVKGALSSAVCLLSAGTTSVQGVLTYAQR